jgi:hypothetical protein
MRPPTSVGDMRTKSRPAGPISVGCVAETAFGLSCQSSPRPGGVRLSAKDQVPERHAEQVLAPFIQRSAGALSELCHSPSWATPGWPAALFRSPLLLLSSTAVMRQRLLTRPPVPGSRFRAVRTEQRRQRRQARRCGPYVFSVTAVPTLCCHMALCLRNLPCRRHDFTAGEH